MDAANAPLPAWWTQWSADPGPTGPGHGALSPAYERAGSWLRERPRLVDGVVALLVGLCALPQLLFWARQPQGGFVARLVLTLLLVVPLVLRRRFPLATFAFAAVVALVQWGLGITLAADIALLVYLATVSAAYRMRVSLLAALVVEAGVVLAALRWDFAQALGLPFLPALLLLSAPVLAAWLVGAEVRSRRQTLDALRDRAVQLEQAQQQRAAMAVAAERARIAREMHDVVAHSVAVMVTLSDGAAAKAARDPERAAAAMRQVSATGHQALEEMRGLLGVLRSDDGGPGRRPQPGLAEIEDVVSQLRATGLAVSSTVSGDAAAVPDGVALTVHRVVQEATTNTLKHAAGPTRIDIRVEVAADEVRLEVHDDGGPSAARTGAGGAGLGLLGMHERVAVHGGTLDAGPDPAGGWTVRAALPLPPAAPAVRTDGLGRTVEP